MLEIVIGSVVILAMWYLWQAVSYLHKINDNLCHLHSYWKKVYDTGECEREENRVVRRLERRAVENHLKRRRI